jgi:parallel beta-helix repeat protein
MRNILLTSLICLFLVAPTFSASAEEISGLWLKAEEKKDNPAVAVELWQQIVDRFEQGETAKEGLSITTAKNHLFHAYLELAEKNRSMVLLKKAQAVSVGFDEDDRIFADVLISEAAAPLDKKLAVLTLRKASKNAEKLKDRRRRSEALHAISMAALTKRDKDTLYFKWDGPELVEDILPYIELSKQRADIMQRLAQYQPKPTGKDAAALHNLVKQPVNKKDQIKQRNNALMDFYKKARKSQNNKLAIEALSAVMDVKQQQEEFHQWFKEVFAAGKITLAALLAARQGDGKYAAKSWGELAKHYAKAGEQRRARDASEKAYYAGLLTRREERRAESLVEVADFAAESGNADIAKQAFEASGILIENVKEKTGRNSIKALSAYIKALAEANRLAEAGKLLREVNFGKAYELKTPAVAALAKALAEKGQTSQAIDLMNDKMLLQTKRTDKAYYAIAKELALQKDFERAYQIQQRIKDKATRLKSKAYIDSRRIKAEHSSFSSEPALKAPFFSALEKDFLSLTDNAKETVALDLIESFLGEAKLPIDKWGAYISSPNGKDRHVALRSFNLLKNGDIPAASRLMKGIQNPISRAKYFRDIAKEISLTTDLYGFLGSKKAAVIDDTKERVIQSSDATQTSPEKIEALFETLSQEKNRGVEMAAPTASDLGFSIPEFDFPERLNFDYDYVKAKLPSITPIRLHLSYYENNFQITKFKIAIQFSENNQRNNIVAPHLIYLSKGVATLPLLYETLKARGLEGYIDRNGKDYTLHHSILIGSDAELVIDGGEVETLYASTQGSAFIVNAGSLYITGTKMIGWDVDKQQPAMATYKDRHEFRPFIASWSRSHSYIAGNEFKAIGYNNHKSYGISLSAGPEKLQSATITEPPRPDAIIVDNSFDNLYYGFYSYEADDVALIGNEYKDNVVYGIDPHDRSNHLTIAYNTAYNAEKKHGIIISREVNNSSFVGNLSFDNKGSGFMIDRLSTGTFVYGNTAFGNKQDGLTLFESSCNFIASNHFFKNKSLGIRVRNSQDNGIFFNRIAHNRQAAVNGYTSELLDDPAHKRRNFTLDPYADVTAMSLVGNEIEDNGVGIIAKDVTAVLLRANRFIDQSPKMFGGDWFLDHSYFTSQYDIANKGIYMGQKCPTGKWIPHQCRFRQMGSYAGDAQDGLEERVNNSSCHVTSKQDQPHA